MRYSPQERRAWLLQLGMAGAGGIVCLWFDWRAACVSMLAAAGMLVVQQQSRRKTQRQLTALCDRLDEILHGVETVQLAEFEEGALSILASEIRKMTIRLREQNKALDRDKVFMKEALEDMSHQLRTPLTTMQVITGMLRKPELDKQQRIAYVQELTGLLSRMQWMLETLLQTARLEAGAVTFRKEQSQVVALIQAALSPLSISMELKGITLHTEVEGQPMLIGDRQFYTEALGNLLKNCMEHTPPGGEIAIRAGQNSLYTWIRITDPGEGIAPEDLPHVFERFYRSGTFSKKGYGIGLSFAQKVFAAQGGSIQVRNAVPHGAEFEIRSYTAAQV